MYVASFAVLVVWISLTSADAKKFSHNGNNPGKCSEEQRGNFTIVQDRHDNDILLICTKRNELYSWKTTDGSDLTGEFFNPAYDCSDILNKNAAAKNGFYWIKLSGNAPRKVWCDMITDGGGFMLVGRKNNSVTWTVPSNEDTVEPFGEPHWTSSLGDAPIVDFRVQVATQEDFSETRSHWSLRLRHKRPLKKLLMVNDGDCGRLSPGIGDISYVKDLQTEKIVTTTFRCSHFGTYYPEQLRFGWAMMNYCLEHPCPDGFAYHHKLKIQTDQSGAFSYSASETSSGISHNSTAFVGCDNNKCCACFGPVGGTENYCGTECKAENNGTIAKNVYTWFWLRSSLPKRLWSKCMEYKKANVDGKIVWYKIHDGNNVPVMGRCNQNEALLNDGIVVVPDGTAAQKVPPVQGLLEYRKDNENLYVRSNGTWNVIGEEKKVLEKAARQINPRIDELEKKMSNLLNKEFSQLKKEFGELKSQLNSVKRKVSKLINKVYDPTACAILYKSGERRDGVYTIDPKHHGPLQVRCDMTTDGGGWTVFQRRLDGSVDFYRGWQDYKNGFGNLSGEFWLGLDKIHRLTQSEKNVLRVDLTDSVGKTAYAKYGTFSVASESDSYTLTIGSFSGTAGDSLKYHSGRKFSTKDRNNGSLDRNCAVRQKSGWWYEGFCFFSNVNGQYTRTSRNFFAGMSWSSWKNDLRSLRKTEMKIRPAHF